MRIADGTLDSLARTLDEPDLSGTRYRVVSRLGQGGMGAVWEAEDATLSRRVALKVVDPVVDGEELARRLLAEARILGRLEHPGIVPVHDAGTLPDGRVFYAMKLVTGARLDEAAARLPTRPERLRLFLRVLEPVAFAHAKGVVHRDLKPANVMVGSFGEVLVMDWGVAKVLGTSLEEGGRATLPGPGETAAGSVVGTPGWMAPEQQTAGEVDARTDVWALGRLLAHLLEPLGPVPKPLRAIAAKASATPATDRYPTVDALALDVTRYLDGESVSASPESALERAARFASRHRVALLLLATYLLTRALVLFFARR